MTSIEGFHLILHIVKNIFFGLIPLIIFVCLSCSKDQLLDTTGRVRIDKDTIRFDTIFTSAGSITNYFLIKNENKNTIRISNLQLIGGNSSFFKINVDGNPGTQFNNLEIEGEDSLYVFVRVNIQPNSDQLPFLIRDSIKIEANGFTSYKQLEAWGQNARYLRNGILKTNTTWTNELPYVILGGITIDTVATLTIEKGTRIHLNADAPMIVNGTLIVNGTKSDSVVFQGNRLDEPYKNFPGSWPGIYIKSSSKDNLLTHARITNAYQGIVAELPAANSNPKIKINNCIIDQAFDAGLLGINSSIEVSNTQITNCGNNIALVLGGNYSFNHCTIVSYSNAYISHKNPVLLASNFIKQNNQIFSDALNAQFVNSIFWGSEGFVENEVVVQKDPGASLNVVFDHVLFRVKEDPKDASFINVIRNQDPSFDSVDVSKRYFDFKLKSNSPAINKGKATSLLSDFYGLPRNGLPDLGCYEKQ
jgi:hypothetical protein